MHLDGWNLRNAALIWEAVLAEFLADAPTSLLLSEHIEDDGSDPDRRACELDGIVSKVRDALYRAGRPSGWVKATCRKRGTFFAIGIARKRGKFDGIYFARPDRDALLYAGKL